MYDAYEKKAALEEVMRLLERAKDELAGMRFIGLENDLEDLMRDVAIEAADLDEDIALANEEQEEEQERDYYASVI